MPSLTIGHALSPFLLFKKKASPKSRFLASKKKREGEREKVTYRQCNSRAASKSEDKIGNFRGGGGIQEPAGDGGPCLGRLISQSGQTALLGAP